MQTQKRVRLAEIVFDAGTQIRAAINESVVAEYAERMSEGVQFPAVVLFHDGNAYYMADGFHRAMAAQRNQFREIDADVRAGTKTDALWYALGANRTNGQRLSETDKKHAIVLALRAWPDRSQTQIAEQVGCAVPYVTRIRAQVFTSEDLPARVTGKDGKSYPATHAQSIDADAANAKRAAVAERIRAGDTSRDIATALRVRPDFVAEVRRELGVGKDNTRAAVAQRRQDVRDMAGRGFTTRQIASAVGLTEQRVADVAKKEGITIHADRVVGKTKRHDSNRIVAQIVADAANLTEGEALIEYADLDRAQLAEWLRSLQASRDKLGAFIRRLMKEQQHGEAA